MRRTVDELVGGGTNVEPTEELARQNFELAPFSLDLRRSASDFHHSHDGARVERVVSEFENTVRASCGRRDSSSLNTHTLHRPPVIETARLSLVVLLPSEIEALIQGDTKRATQLAGATFPSAWPEHAEAQEGLTWHLRHLRADAAQQAWRIRVMVERQSGVVVGSINLKGPPNAHGDVEIGWGVNEDRRRRGYAFEATSAVLKWAACEPGVRVFSATIPEDNVSSQQLAKKLGMARTSETRRGLPVWIRAATA